MQNKMNMENKTYKCVPENRFWFFWRVIIAFGKHPEKPLPQGVGKVLYQRGL